MNVAPNSNGEIFFSKEDGIAFGINEEHLVELTKETLEHINPRYPINHQSNREKLRRLKQMGVVK